MKKKGVFIVGFILGAIIFGFIGVYAAFSYNANQITYTKGNNTMYLSDAIDELYTTQGTTVSNLQNQVVTKNATINDLNSQLNQSYTIYTYLQKTSSGSGNIYLNMNQIPFVSRYNKFTLSSHVESGTSVSCVTKALTTVDRNNGSWSDTNISTGVTYNIADYNRVAYSVTASSTTAMCLFSITLSK